MPPIDRTGLYKGEIKDFGVTATRKAKLPQFVVTLMATELYNEATETWEEWAQYERTIIGYLVLVSLDKQGQVVKCFAYDNLVEALGWDGETYSSLAAMNLKGTRVQFKVIEDTYNDQTTMKVHLIAAENAEIGLRKLSGKDLTALDAQFGVVSDKKRTAATPKGKKNTAAAPAAPAAPKAGKKSPPKAAKSPEPVQATCTEDEAYQACLTANEGLEKPVPSEILDDYWLVHVEGIAADVKKVTDEEWAQIRQAVLEDIAIPF